MAYEIDFLPVGEEKPGDALTLRFGDLNGPRHRQAVVVIDGGYAGTGQTVCDHLNAYYGTSDIDLLISTHPDQDHVAGLETIITTCKVRALWMHRPWNHTDDIGKLFQDGRVTDNSIRESLRKSLEEARTLERLAVQKGIPITEPFTGAGFYPFNTPEFSGDPLNSMGLSVLGPSASFYEALLPEFRCLPDVIEPSGLLQKLGTKLGEAIGYVAEQWGFETLDDSGVTTPENDSSVILLGVMDSSEHFMLTSDAGIPALNEAVTLLERIGYDFGLLKFVQVPHHGSRRNVGPAILDRLLGPKRSADVSERSAFVSVTATDHPKHPSKRVLNAFRRRGCTVHATAGWTKQHHKGAPARAGWGPSVPVPFFTQVEE